MIKGSEEALFDVIGEADEFEQLKGEKTNLAKASKDAERKHSVSIPDIIKSDTHHPFRTSKKLSSNCGPRQAALDNRSRKPRHRKRRIPATMRSMMP
jgi:hypothetical protein